MQKEDWSYSGLSSAWSIEQRAFAERAIVRAKAEIVEDIARGRVSAAVSDFDELKRRVTDAGAYGGLWELDIEELGETLFPPPNPKWSGPGAGYDWACTVIRQAIHEWLKQGRPSDG
ncbi:hypothetical protein [Pandoraea sp. ISTKB]|uniref:hypothetical protein n=1 Tax=Pandoraea sp. ISTKB TaxID=1586708 RepID=UPI001112D341|nr:hypothetical protein [Pandoraea sp. ISTKB]